jgi:glycosyltransferase involved in cell wall biosynthesis
MGRKDIGIFVTVSPAHGSPAKRFISKIRENGRDAVICNLGEVPFKDVRSCYDIAHALLLPTFLESFSNAYLDAMRSGAGIITSDMDFARVVCGDAALYVDPSDVSAVVSALLSLESDTVEWKKRVDIGKRRVDKFFLRWDEIAGKMVSALEKAADGLNAPDILDDPWMKEYQLLQRPDRMR